MSQQDILTLAKQGDPRAIATLLNRSTQPHGITVKAARQQQDLFLLLEADQVPDETGMVAMVRQAMVKLEVASVHLVKIFGRQAGVKTALWSQELQLPLVELQPETSATLDLEMPAVEEISENSLTPDPDPTSTLPAELIENDAIDSLDLGAALESENSFTESVNLTDPVEESGPPMESVSVKVPLGEQVEEDYWAETPVETRSIAAPESIHPFADQRSPQVGSEVSGGSPASDPADPSPVPTDPSLREAEIRALLQKPEALAVLLVVLLVTLWEAYFQVLDEAEIADGALSGRGLARRLETSASTVRRRRDQADFGDWSQQLDPDGIAWVYREDGKFVPRL